MADKEEDKKDKDDHSEQREGESIKDYANRLRNMISVLKDEYKYETRTESMRKDYAYGGRVAKMSAEKS